VAVLESTAPKTATKATASHAAIAPSAARMAAGRNGVGDDDGTSKCDRNNDDRDFMQRGFPHDG
jgi:hypothetical protein